MELLRDHGALSPTSISEEIGVSRQSVRHHLSVLSDRNLVSVTRKRRRVRCFSPGTPEALREAMTVLSCDGVRRVAADVASEPRRPPKERARSFGITRQAVWQHLQTLEEEALVRRAGYRGRPQHEPTRLLERALSSLDRGPGR